MKKISYLVLTPLILAACGGGGGSSGSTNLTGQFIDAPVEGLYFVSSTGVTGTTDASGTFEFKAGDTVTFKIGGANGLELAAVTPTPAANAQIKVADLPASSQIAQVLQTFGCPSGQDCSETKLDLKNITFTDAQKTKLKEHFDTRGDLDTFASDPAVTTMITAVGTAAGKTFAPKTKADVAAHIAKADAKIPTTNIPSFNIAMMVNLSNKRPGFWGFDKKAGTIEILESNFTSYAGTFKQSSGKQIDIDWKTYDTIGEETGKLPVPIGCSSTLVFDGMLTNQESNAYGFKLKGTDSEKCNVEPGQPTKYDLAAIPLDETFSINDLSGKKLTITGAKNAAGETCDKPIVIEFSTVSNGALSVKQPEAADPDCGDLDLFGWGPYYFGGPTERKLQPISKTNSILQIDFGERDTEFGKVYEQVWLVKTKGIDPKIVAIWAGNADWTKLETTSFQFFPPVPLTYSIK